MSFPTSFYTNSLSNPIMAAKLGMAPGYQGLLNHPWARPGHSVPPCIPRQGTDPGDKATEDEDRLLLGLLSNGTILIQFKKFSQIFGKTPVTFPVFKAQEFTADERNLPGNTFPREQKCVWHRCLLQARGPPYWQGSQHLLENATFFFFISRYTNC